MGLLHVLDVRRVPISPAHTHSSPYSVERLGRDAAEPRQRRGGCGTCRTGSGRTATRSNAATGEGAVEQSCWFLTPPAVRAPPRSLGCGVATATGRVGMSVAGTAPTRQAPEGIVRRGNISHEAASRRVQRDARTALDDPYRCGTPPRLSRLSSGLIRLVEMRSDRRHGRLGVDLLSTRVSTMTDDNATESSRSSRCSPPRMPLAIWTEFFNCSRQPS